MIRTLHTKTCAFDCEWVPCAATARRLLGLPADTDERTALEAVWAHYRSADDAPESRPFLKLALSQVVSIAVVMRQVDAAGAVHLNLGVRTLAHSPEGNLIQRFLEKVAAEQYQLWGYNSASADLPILLQRAIALAVLCPTFSKRAGRNGWDYHNKWSDAHMDILEIIGGYGSSAKKPKLGEFAVACGFSGKLDVDGAEVADLYLAGHLDEIAEYNETDAVTTHLLMLRVGLHTGLLPPDRYTTEIEAVEQLVAEQAAKGKAQFEKFASAWAALKP
jgi:predicted PolB exonuclease-like 3'-5' exonuclease